MSKEISRRKHIQENLCTLYDEYIDHRNAEIDEENKKIEVKNKEKMSVWKKQIQRGSKPTLTAKKPKYTQAEFIRDFQRQYPIEMYRSKLNQYLNGTTTPSDDVLYYFAKFFDVAYDFLIGKSRIRKPETEQVQKFINLNDEAISTLRSIEKDSIECTVLNSILSNKRAAKTFLLNIYEHAYHTYRRSQTTSPSDETQKEDIFYNMDQAMALTYYIEKYFMPHMTPTFQERLQNDLNYAYYRSHHYEQYEADMQRDLDECYSHYHKE